MAEEHGQEAAGPEKDLATTFLFLLDVQKAKRQLHVAVHESFEIGLCFGSSLTFKKLV